MTSLTNEQALESAIEKKLSGTTLEELKALGITNAFAEDGQQYRSGNGYWIGNPQDFNKELHRWMKSALTRLQKRPEGRIKKLKGSLSGSYG